MLPRFLALALLGSLLACSAPAPEPASGKLEVTCTVGMLGDLVRRIGGDRVSAIDLMGPGTDPHLYQALPSDRRRLTRSDLVLYCGHHLEGKMASIFESFSARVPTVAVCEKIEAKYWLADPAEEGAVDPHLWFDVAAWARVAEQVRDELTAVDPEGASDYASRTESCVQELHALDEDVRQRLAAIPAERRVMITAHDAFRYFGRAYDVEVIGLQGLSTEDEAAVRRVNELVDLIVKRKIPAVFVESTINEKSIRSLVEGCRSRGHEVSIGGELFSDAMGAKDTDAGTYNGMVRHNVETVVSALTP